MAPTNSSSQSRRWPKPVPKSMPWAVCSGSIHAPPMPRIARPSLTWSSVAADLGDEARVPERVGTDEEPQSRLLRLAGPRVEQRPALEDRLVRVAEDRVNVIPRPQVRIPEPIDPPGRVEHLIPGPGLAPEQDPELHIGHGRWASGWGSVEPGV